MTNHPFDLKGIDTGKIGNNKNVNLTFKEYQKLYGLSDSGAKRDLEAKNVLLSDLQPVTPEVKPSVKGKVAQFLFGNPGAEQELVDGKLMAKSRQKGLGRFTAGLSDALTLNLTDFDQRGGGFLGLKDVNPISGLGGKPEDFILPKTIADAVAADQKESKPDEGSKNPVDIIKEAYEAQMDYEKQMDPFKRKGRALDSAMEFANLRAQMPFYMNQLKDLSTFKQAQLLEAERAKQGMPNAVQARLLAGDTGFAQQAAAISGQQDSATRFAGLGMQRRFG